MKYRIVTASHKIDVLNANLRESEFFQKTPVDDITLLLNGDNIPRMYNHARRGEDFTIYVHHDVFLPPTFERELKAAIELLPYDWGVLGVAGARFVGSRILIGHVNDRGRPWGRKLDRPERVETLDELILIVNSQYDLKFDEQFTQDFYGADICMQANEIGLKNFVIPAYCHHNSSRKVGERTPSFYDSEKKFAAKWSKWLPLATTCSILLPNCR